MKPLSIILALALGVSAGNLAAQERAGGPPPGERPPPPPEGGAQAGQQQRPGGPRLLPPGAEQALKLTSDQQKQLADLEADVKAKIEKILTPEQLDQLKQMRPPQRPLAPRGGGQGGGQKGGQKGGGQGGPPGGAGNPAGPGEQAPPPPPPPDE